MGDAVGEIFARGGGIGCVRARRGENSCAVICNNLKPALVFSFSMRLGCLICGLIAGSCYV